MRFKVGCTTAALTLSLITASSAQSAETSSNESSPARHREPVLQPHTALYSVTYNGLPIQFKRTLSPSGDGFQAATLAENFLGTVSESETFSVSSSGKLQPTRYQYRRSLLGKDRTEESDFASSGKSVHTTYKGSTLTLENPEPLLGPLGYQIQLQLDLLAGKKQFEYDVVSRGKIREYAFHVTGTDALTTPFGMVDAVVLERERDDGTRKTLVWLAPELDYLPVKLIQDEDGERYEMRIESYTEQSE